MKYSCDIQYVSQYVNYGLPVRIGKYFSRSQKEVGMYFDIG
jgi:hypothetical protein